MTHLKKDFRFHKKFDNKYINHTYYSYLYRDKVKFVQDGWSWTPAHASYVYDFIIACNNDISRRGSIEKAKERIKINFEKLKNKKFYLTLSARYYYYNKQAKYDTLDKVADLIESLNDCNELQKKEALLIRELYYWCDNFETDFSGFMDFIYDEITLFDNQHYDWIVGENIIYNRSVRDNEKKRVYCAINNEKANKRFKKAYFDNISIESNLKNKLYNQISFLLVTIGDVNNLFVSKEFKKAKELLNDYTTDNLNMDSCYDIYYRKIYENICEICNQYNKKNDSTLTFNEIQKIIVKENDKYKEYITLYEAVSIDLEQNEYSNIINL